MRIAYLFLFFPVLALLSCSVYSQYGTEFQHVTPSDTSGKEDRQLAPFSGVDVCCSIEVDIYQADEYRAVIEAPDNMLKFVHATVQNGVLEIGMKPDRIYCNPGRIYVAVYVPAIDRVRASSSSVLRSSDLFGGDQLDVACSSSGTLQFMFEGEYVDVEASSSGTVELAGTARKVDVQASSSADVSAYNLHTQEARATVSSSGSVYLHVSEMLEATASSSGKVRYRGSPNHLSAETNSSGSIRKAY